MSELLKDQVLTLIHTGLAKDGSVFEIDIRAFQICRAGKINEVYKSLLIYEEDSKLYTAAMSFDEKTTLSLMAEKPRKAYEKARDNVAGKVRRMFLCTFNGIYPGLIINPNNHTRVTNSIRLARSLEGKQIDLPINPLYALVPIALGLSDAKARLNYAFSVFDYDLKNLIEKFGVIMFTHGDSYTVLERSLKSAPKHLSADVDFANTVITSGDRTISYTSFQFNKLVGSAVKYIYTRYRSSELNANMLALGTLAYIYCLKNAAKCIENLQTENIESLMAVKTASADLIIPTFLGACMSLYSHKRVSTLWKIAVRCFIKNPNEKEYELTTSAGEKFKKNIKWSNAGRAEFGIDNSYYFEMVTDSPVLYTQGNDFDKVLKNGEAFKFDTNSIKLDVFPEDHTNDYFAIVNHTLIVNLALYKLGQKAKTSAIISATYSRVGLEAYGVTEEALINNIENTDSSYDLTTRKQSSILNGARAKYYTYSEIKKISISKEDRVKSNSNELVSEEIKRQLTNTPAARQVKVIKTASPNIKDLIPGILKKDLDQITINELISLTFTLSAPTSASLKSFMIISEYKEKAVTLGTKIIFKGLSKNILSKETLFVKKYLEMEDAITKKAYSDDMALELFKLIISYFKIDLAIPDIVLRNVVGLIVFNMLCPRDIDESICYEVIKVYAGSLAGYIKFAEKLEKFLNIKTNRVYTFVYLCCISFPFTSIAAFFTMCLLDSADPTTTAAVIYKDYCALCLIKNDKFKPLPIAPFPDFD